ncbi:MAG: DoxX family protein [Thermocladium sp.]
MSIDYMVYAMLQAIIEPLRSQGAIGLGLLIYRVLYGIALLPHGIPKMPGSRMRGQLREAMKQMGVHPALFDLAAIIEFLGSIFIILGLLTGFTAAVLTIYFIALVIVSTTKMKKPFPTGMSPGWDLDLMFLIGALLLLFTGAGPYSIDSALNLVLR